MKKMIFVLSAILVVCVALCGCEAIEDTNIENTNTAIDAAYGIIENQPVPTDIDYSLERYNVVRRAYWVNGQREKANMLICPVEKPLGYIVLFSESGSVVGNFVVDGKVSSLNSYLFPAYIDVTSDGLGAVATYSVSRACTSASVFSVEIPGIDGTYGSNVSGIFFFDINGNYIEWTGNYLYTDIPVDIKDPILKFEAVESSMIGDK